MRFLGPTTLAVMRTAALVPLACVLGLAALPQVVPPEQLQRVGAVNDFANVLSPADRDALEQRAISLEERDGVDVAMVTVSSTGDTPVFDYAFALFQHWGVGQKGRNNGTLILLAIRDRKFSVQVGRGLEPYFTDADAGHWMREETTDLRAGRYATVLNAMLDHIEQTVAGRMGTEGKLRPEAPRPSAPQISPIAVFVVIIVILVLLSLLRRATGCGPMGCLPIFWGGPGWGGGYYGGGWSGGGFGGFGGGGGGGGGFGGFGGGEAGGGGASGGW